MVFGAGKGFGDGFGDQSSPGKMHDGVYLVLQEHLFELQAVRKIYLAKHAAGQHSGAVALHQIIQGDDGHAARNQDFRADTADVARSPGNENIHLYALLEFTKKPRMGVFKIARTEGKIRARAEYTRREI